MQYYFWLFLYETIKSLHDRATILIKFSKRLWKPFLCIALKDDN